MKQYSKLQYLPVKRRNSIYNFSLLRTLHSTDFNIKFLWAPAHVGIVGNEYVDNLASLTYLSPYSGVPVCPYSDFPPYYVLQLKIFGTKWRHLPPAFAVSYRHLIPYIPNNIQLSDLKIYRNLIVQFTSLRMGHNFCLLTPSNQGSMGTLVVL